ncbi:MAG: VanW family protein [Clostridia bacterium]|nr:VanW family protein [Clostridia bacterium]
MTGKKFINLMLAAAICASACSCATTQTTYETASISEEKTREESINVEGSETEITTAETTGITEVLAVDTSDKQEETMHVSAIKIGEDIDANIAEVDRDAETFKQVYITKSIDVSEKIVESDIESAVDEEEETIFINEENIEEVDNKALHETMIIEEYMKIKKEEDEWIEVISDEAVTSNISFEGNNSVESDVIVLQKVTSVPANTVMAIATQLVNFRTAPNTSSYVITSIKPESMIYILGELSTINGFYHCVYNGILGYIDKNCVSLDTLEMYAVEDTIVEIGSKKYRVPKDGKLVMYKSASGAYLYHATLEKVKDYSMLLTKSEYYKQKMEDAGYELVTSFSTNYSLAELYAGKAFNIQHCLDNPDLPNRSINGRVVLKGETFNWFRDVGDTGKKEGYILANIFSGGKVIKGYGGGVCQVSSTIYNCVLNLGLKVIERHAHGMPVYYVDYYSGKDASVSDVGGGFNFIFENTTDYDIYIKAYVDVDKKQTIDKQGVLTVEFYKIIY